MVFLIFSFSLLRFTAVSYTRLEAYSFSTVLSPQSPPSSFGRTLRPHPHPSFGPLIGGVATLATSGDVKVETQ
ncbi:hypothetical protein F4775DRAFT_574855 [Biscogniauxia sp. FL1348]|nr:hypothetical protein F4775DRAFT_574855 [Biscogniauxia sp. FL1348]